MREVLDVGGEPVSGTLRVSPHVHTHELDEELVLYDSCANRAYVFNASATLLWRFCGNSPTIDEAVRELAGTYNRDVAEVTRDVVEFVKAARAAGLLLPEENEPNEDAT